MSNGFWTFVESFLRNRFATARSKARRARTAAAKRPILHLEILEDRLVPTTASVVQAFSFGPTATNWNTNLGAFNRFNSALGTLTSVVVNEAAGMNLSGGNGKGTSVSDSVAVDAALPNSNNMSVPLSVSSTSKGAWNLSNSGQQTLTFTAATAMAAFVGAGTYTVGSNTVSGTLSFTGKGLKASNFTTTADVTVTVTYDYTPAPPTVATAASATPSPVTGTTTNLSVLGADPAGASSLTYSWTTTSEPAGVAAPTFSANGTNAAQNSVATFHAAGSYTFLATIADPYGLTATSSVTVVVSQTVASLTISPSSVSLAGGANQQFAASAHDQFGNGMTTQPTFTWAMTAGLGTLSGSGMYTAPGSSTTATIKASFGSVSNTATATVTATNAPPTVATPASATPSAVTGTTTSLSVLGADDGGAANLTYSWTTTSAPTGAPAPTFSANGTNAAQNSVATFHAAGSYTFLATISDQGGLTATSSVTVVVSQTVTSLTVSPGSVSLSGNGTQQFTASAKDQFGNAMSPQPTFTWTLTAGLGSLSASGLYTAPGSNTTATIKASAGTVSNTATATVTAVNAAPTVATAAAATPSPVTGTTTNLSVLGADDGGEANLTYTWTVTSAPSGAPAVGFSANGTNAAQNSTATFHAAGSYTFLATITDQGGLTANSSVTVVVSQTVTSLTVSPGSVSLSGGGTQQFTASASDQFGNAMSPQPTFTWTLTAGLGTLSTSGLYTAPGSSTTATIKASAGSVSNTATATVTAGNTAPTVATPAAATPSPVTGTTTSLSVLGADNGGEASLTYTWTVTSAPSAAPAVVFSANGTNAAKNTVATFGAAGSYTFLATITDASGLTATSSVTVTVNQTLTTMTLLPGTLTIDAGASQQFTPSVKDQFGNPMSTWAQNYTWTLSGGGTLSSTGVYTAPASGTATIQASAGGLTATAAVTVDSSFTPGVYFDSTTGILTVKASGYQNTLDLQVTSLNGVQYLLVTFQDSDSAGNLIVGQTPKYVLSQVTQVVFFGQAGYENTVNNYTALTCTAYGGTGINVFQGGSGINYLYAGGAGSNNSLNAGAGGTTEMIGGAGTNNYYPAATGIDTIIFGIGRNYLN